MDLSKPFFKFNNLGAAIILLLLGSFLLGVSYISALPIWEGFDETAHFSYVQQVADSGELPFYGKDQISKVFVVKLKNLLKIPFLIKDILPALL